MQQKAQQQESLSAYMDGEVADTDIAETLCGSAELQQQWADFHTIRSVMRGEEQFLGSDFSAKMEALIADEEIEAQPRGMTLKLKRWSTSLMQAGVAAGVCLVAVFGVNMMNSDNSQQVADAEPVLQTLPFVNSVQQVSLNVQELEKQKTDREAQEEQNQQMKTLMQNPEQK